VIRVKTGRYGPQGSIGSSSKSVTFIGEPGTTVDTGSSYGTYNHFNLSGNVTVESVDIEGDHPMVQIYGNNNTWRKSTFHSGRQIRRCGADEPIIIQDGDATTSYTINNTLLQDLVIEQQKAARAGELGCPSNDPFHLELIRVGRGVSNLTMDRVLFGPCPNGSNFVGCGSGQLFLTTTVLNQLPPRNVVLRNSRFMSTVNYHIQSNQNIGSSNVSWTLAYNTFGTSEPIAMNGPHQGVAMIGNLGTRPQNCTSGVAFTKNVWQWGAGTPCGTDKRVTGDSYSTNALGLNADLSLSAGSPAIDAAEPMSGSYCQQLGNVDYDGHLRPVGAACDAGADEKQ
jgi:hypothetical protein